MKTRLPGNFTFYIIISLLVACGDGGDDAADELCSASNNTMPGCPASTLPPAPPPLGFTSNVVSIALALDGSDDVYVGGVFQIYNNSSVKRIARLNNDSSLDTGFVTGRGFDSIVYSVASAIDGSGDVYVGGRFTNYDGTAVGSGLIRLNDDGSLDAGFNTGSGWGESEIAPATDGSGDVYVTRDSSPGVARLNDDGSIDAGFNTGLSGFNDGAWAIAVASDGSGDIYVAGPFSDYNGMGINGLARLNSDGSLDVGFATDAGFVGRGAFITPAIDGSGDIYVDNNINGDIVRLNDDGSIDTKFDVGPYGFDDPGPYGSDYPLRCLALTTDGSGDIYVGGSFNSFNLSPVEYMVRLTSGGVLVR